MPFSFTQEDCLVIFGFCTRFIAWECSLGSTDNLNNCLFVHICSQLLCLTICASVTTIYGLFLAIGSAQFQFTPNYSPGLGD